MQYLSFKPRWIPAIATALGVMLFVHLGNWQADKGERRAEEMAQFQSRGQQGPYLLDSTLLDAASLQDAPVTVYGRYLPDEQFYLDNRLENGQPGVHLVTPLQIRGGTTRVLVNRGWIAWPDRHAPLPVVDTPTGEVQVSGIASLPSGKKFFLMPSHPDEKPGLWSRLDLERFAAMHPQPLQAFVILQHPGDAADRLLRHWPAPEDRVAMHRSYSLQWYGMACALVVFFCVASWRKRVKT